MTNVIYPFSQSFIVLTDKGNGQYYTPGTQLKIPTSIGGGSYFCIEKALLGDSSIILSSKLAPY